MAKSRTLQILITAKDKATKQLKKLESTFKLVGKAATVAFAAASAATGFAIKEFADFEKSMSSVKAITNATGEEFEDLTDLAEEMGATTVFTASEASEAMKFLGMAGFETDEIMQSLQGTMNLASAAVLDLGTSADIMSNVLTGFRLQASESERVVDVLAKTITSSNTDMVQLGEAMKFFAPTAASFGVSIEEASAAVGLLGNAGLQGSIATRALSTSFNRLAKPSNEMFSIMQELNLEFFDANGTFIGLTNTLKLLEDRLDGASQEQQALVISTLFGQEALKQWNILLSAGSEELEKFTGELEDSGGTAQRMADTQLDNLAGSFTLLKSAVSGAAIEFGEKFAPVVKIAVEELTKFIAIENKTEAVTSFLTESISKISQAIEDKTGLITILTTAFERISTVFKELVLPELVRLLETLKPLEPIFIFLAKVIGLTLYGALILVVKLLEVTLIPLLSLLGSTIGVVNDYFLKPLITSIDFLWEGLKKVVEWATKAFNKLKKLDVFEGAKSLVTNVLGFGGARANGGPVQSGKSFLVGERGPEIFSPNTNGKIIPNNKVGNGGGGGGIVININGDVTGNEIVEKVKRALMMELNLNNRITL